MHEFQRLNSIEDASINWVTPLNSSFVESRYVQRTTNDGKTKAVIYLSSQNGCSQSCKFCHLTQTKQTTFTHVTKDDFVAQAEQPLLHAENQDEIVQLNFNFMARGEPLLNPVVATDWMDLSYQLAQSARALAVGDALVKFNVSSIVPREIHKDELPYVFRNLLANQDTYLYYSLYSLERAFRREWLPKSHSPILVLDILRALGFLHKVVYHWAYIEGANDSLETTYSITTLLRFMGPTEMGRKPRINIVRFNPVSDSPYHEPTYEIIERNVKILSEVADVKIINRVGFDIKASCGMFVGKADLNKELIK